MNRYPRDLLGYGATPPVADWPDEAAIAVQFVLNYEEGGENCILHGDPESEAFLSESIGATAYPGARNWNMETQYEYGARAGFWRLHRIFTGADVPLTVFGVATALARSPDAVAAMKEADWEIASHGLKWIDYRGFTPENELEHMRQAIELHQQVTGIRPLGWYTGRVSINTVRLAAAKGGFAYLSDSYADELPYWQVFDDRPQLIVPYTLDANDMRFSTAQGFNSGDQFFAYLRDSFDCLYAEGLAGAPKMMSVGLHCRLGGRPGRAHALQKFIDHVRAHPKVWLARRIDIADHWHREHPYAPAQLQPSIMHETAFMDTFGSIYPGVPEIAARAFASELGPAHDTLEGIHSILTRQFRATAEEERARVTAALGARDQNNDAPAGDADLAEAERIARDKLKEKFGR